MGIVEPCNPFSARIVNRKRIFQAMRPLCRSRNCVNFKLNTMPLVAHVEHLTVQVQKGIKRLIGFAAVHFIILSVRDNSSSGERPVFWTRLPNVCLLGASTEILTCS